MSSQLLFVRIEATNAGPKIRSRQKRHLMNCMTEHPILGFGPSPGGQDYPDNFKQELWKKIEAELNVLPGVRYDAAGYCRVRCYSIFKETH